MSLGTKGGLNTACTLCHTTQSLSYKHVSCSAEVEPCIFHSEKACIINPSQTLLPPVELVLFPRLNTNDYLDLFTTGHGERRSLWKPALTVCVMYFKWVHIKDKTTLCWLKHGLINYTSRESCKNYEGSLIPRISLAL